MSIASDIEITPGEGEEWVADIQSDQGYAVAVDVIGEERVTDAERVILTRDEALAIREKCPQRGIVCLCDARLVYGITGEQA